MTANWMAPRAAERSDAPEGASRYASLLWFLFVLAICLAWTIYWARQGDRLCEEAVIRVGVAKDLLAGHVRGRQGLVGSLRWAPLPTLMVLPFLAFVRSGATGIAACLSSAVAAALLVAFLDRRWTKWGVGTISRFFLGLAVACNPVLLTNVVQGSSSLWFVLWIVAATCFLLEWLSSGDLRSLAYLSISLAFAFLTRFQAIWFFAAVLLVLFSYLLSLRKKPKAFVEATLIVVVAPLVYVVCAWIAANWLIMGDPWFFVRGLFRGDRPISWSGLLADGCEWELCVAPVAWVFVGWALAGGSGWKRRIAAASLFVVLGACLVLAVLSFKPPSRSGLSPELRKVLEFCSAPKGQVKEWRPALRGKTVISGYEGYVLLRSLSPRARHRAFIHVMDLYLKKIFADTRGQEVYLLVPEPRGEGRWEDVNLHFPGLYEHGNVFTIFVKGWSHWRLYRVVRTDLP